MSVQINSGAFIEAADRHLPTLLDNLTDGSDWAELIKSSDNPYRANSPYYGPATQFLVDCFLDIVAATPELVEAADTPIRRFLAADFVIQQYISHFTVGPNGLLTKAYDISDIGQTTTHHNRRHHLVHDTDHVLMGAIVPFDDAARATGGAAIMLDDLGKSHLEIPGTISKSTGLHIIAGVHGDKTPKLTNELGQNYFEPKYFEITDDNLLAFTSDALVVIRSILSPVGCPTAKLRDGSTTVFTKYWDKITTYLVDQANYEVIRAELATQHTDGYKVVVTPSSVSKRLLQQPPAPPQKRQVKASGRYTPPKNKR